MHFPACTCHATLTFDSACVTGSSIPSSLGSLHIVHARQIGEAGVLRVGLAVADARGTRGTGRVSHHSRVAAYHRHGIESSLVHSLLCAAWVVDDDGCCAGSREMFRALSAAVRHI